MLSGRPSCSKAHEAASCFSGAICENGRKPARTISSSQPPQCGAQKFQRGLDDNRPNSPRPALCATAGATPCWLGCWLGLRPVWALFLPCAYYRGLGIPCEMFVSGCTHAGYEQGRLPDWGALEVPEAVCFEYERTSDAVVQGHHKAAKRGAYDRARQWLHGVTGLLSQCEQLLCSHANARVHVVLQIEEDLMSQGLAISSCNVCAQSRESSLSPEAV